jgi:hypothetical protein
MLVRLLALAFLCLAAVNGQSAWRDLTPKASLDGWEPIGADGVWTVMQDGTLVGQRNLVPARKHQPEYQNPATWATWLNGQAWLYTKEEFTGDFELELDYWMRFGGNSGVSIGDKSRAAAAVASPPDFRKTPAKIAYEIQINNLYPDPHPSGSIYGFVDAPKDLQKDNEWNRMRIEVKAGVMRVFINGKLAASNPVAPDRPTAGPIGLQLHDRFSVAMFRRIRIRAL